MIRALLCIIVTMTIFISCKDDQAEPTTEVEKERGSGIYYDIKLTGEENGMVTLMIQLRNGSRLAKGKRGELILDGEILEADSTRFTGIYYEKRWPITEFEGNHNLLHREGKTDLAVFDLTLEPLSLATPLPVEVKAKPFTIYLENAGEGDKVQLIMTDTNFESPDVNRDVDIAAGKISINEAMLSRIRTGDILLELVREHKTRLDDTLRGMITKTYSLRRNFELVD